jgi:hypothetical protein
MHTYSQQRVINQYSTHITQTSVYPIPWSDPKVSRPNDYYAQIRTEIIYVRHGKTIRILIPAVQDEDDNRSRRLQVWVDENRPAFSSVIVSSVLNMHETFPVWEMDRLMRLAGFPHSYIDLEEETLRYVSPFFISPGVNYEPGDDMRDKNLMVKTHGEFKKLVTPFIKEMQQKNYSGLKRELYLPVCNIGEPHHWNMVLLAIDADNQFSLTYFDSFKGPFPGWLRGAFFKNILQEINEILITEGCKPIEKEAVKYSCLQQFSWRGCGIAIALLFERLLCRRNTLPEGLLLNPSPIQCPHVDIIEDALTRVELAFAMHKQDSIAAQTNSSYARNLKAVVREFHTIPHTLTKQVQDKPLISSKKGWHLWQKKMQISLDRLQNSVAELVKKSDPDQDEFNVYYQPLSEVAKDLQMRIAEAEMVLSRDTCPSYGQMQALRYDCERSINKALPLFALHNNNAWFQIAPIWRALLGFLATITIVPALLVACFAPYGYQGSFFTTPPVLSESALEEFAANWSP